MTGTVFLFFIVCDARWRGYLVLNNSRDALSLWREPTRALPNASDLVMTLEARSGEKISPLPLDLAFLSACARRLRAWATYSLLWSMPMYFLHRRAALMTVVPLPL